MKNVTVCFQIQDMFDVFVHLCTICNIMQNAGPRTALRSQERLFYAHKCIHNLPSAPLHVGIVSMCKSHSLIHRFPYQIPIHLSINPSSVTYQERKPIVEYPRGLS
jgi:hypothetical protein